MKSLCLLAHFFQWVYYHQRREKNSNASLILLKLRTQNTNILYIVQTKLKPKKETLFFTACEAVSHVEQTHKLFFFFIVLTCVTFTEEFSKSQHSFLTRAENYFCKPAFAQVYNQVDDSLNISR